MKIFEIREKLNKFGKFGNVNYLNISLDYIRVEKTEVVNDKK